MKRSTLSIFLAMVCMVLFAGCNSEEVDVAESQRSAIVSYLTSSHTPRLIDIADVPNSMSPNPAFYERLEYNTFRYVATYYEPGRAERCVVAEGDEVWLTYIACTFTNGKPSLANVYDTNDASTLAQLREAGLKTDYWSTEPMMIKIGESDILKGVELSLIGCHEGDVVEAYLTLDAAYGNKVVGMVGKESAVAWFYVIESVVKP